MPDFPATDPLFLSTLSLRRATPRPSPSCHPVWDFYPRSPCGERPGTIGAAAGTAAISIHALLTESDIVKRCQRRASTNFSPRSPYGERQQMEHLKIPAHGISIHALLAESDLTSVVSSTGTIDFYPRSPCGERRYRSGVSVVGRSDFYPRSPCGERRRMLPRTGHSWDFYPRSPCGERQT